MLCATCCRPQNGYADTFGVSAIAGENLLFQEFIYEPLPFQYQASRGYENGEKIDTEIHYRYICREGKYSKIDGRKEDLVYKASGNLPVWACNNADEFWKQAEANRGKGNGYKEFLLGLQEELDLMDNVALVEKLLEKTGIRDNHVFTYAIHDKEAAFDSEHRNIHCHLMFNEKILEEDRPLEADRFFRRYSLNRKGLPTQGYRTERKFQDRQFIIELRKIWEDIVNEKLAERAIAARVDCRTLEEQYKEKKAEGKHEDARYYDRKPALHLGSGFQNPEEQHSIRQECDRNLEAELNGQEIIYPKPKTIHELKKTIFVRDFVVRKISRFVQKVKQENIEKSKHLMDYAAYLEAKEAALVVTSTDIIDHEQKQIKALQLKIHQLDNEYRNLAPQIISSSKSFSFAMYDVYGNDYIKNKNNPAQIKIYMQDSLVSAKAESYQKEIYKNLAKQEFLGAVYKELKTDYDKARAEKSRLIKEYNRLKELISTARTPEILQQRLEVFKLLQENNARTHSLALALKHYEKEAQLPQNAQEISLIAAKIKSLNDSNRRKLKDIYSEKVRAQYALKKAEQVLACAKELPEDTVIFADKIHPLAVADTKLYGEIKLGSLKLVNIDNECYCILPEQENNSIVKAVKLFDEVVRGKLPVYELKITAVSDSHDNSSSKSASCIKVTKEKAPVYSNNLTSRSQLSPVYAADKENAILKVINKAVATKDMHIAPLWPAVDNTVVDELEKELEQDKVNNYIRL